MSHWSKIQIKHNSTRTKKQTLFTVYHFIQLVLNLVDFVDPIKSKYQMARLQPQFINHLWFSYTITGDGSDCSRFSPRHTDK